MEYISASESYMFLCNGDLITADLSISLWYLIWLALLGVYELVDVGAYDGGEFSPDIFGANYTS